MSHRVAAKRHIRLQGPLDFFQQKQCLAPPGGLFHGAYSSLRQMRMEPKSWELGRHLKHMIGRNQVGS